MRSDRKRKIMTLSILLVSILVISVGFAAFSGTLIIKSKAVINPNPNLFDVKLSKANRVPATTGSVAPTLYPSSETINYSKEIVANNITVDGSTTIPDLNASFVSPGDSVAYKFYVVNEGEYKAYLNNIFIGNKTCTAVDDAQDSLVQEACNGINVTVSVGSKKYTSSKQISNHTLDKKTGEAIIITIEYTRNAARADGPFTVNFGKISFTYSTLNNPKGETEVNKICKLTQDKYTKTQLDVGDEVTCGTESFFVIQNDSSAHPTATNNTVTLITKYNLLVGYTYDGSKRTAITNTEVKQSSDAIGFKNTGFPYIGVIAFSARNYWGSVDSGTFIYNSNSLLYQYVEKYNAYVKSLGVNVLEASLVSFNQISPSISRISLTSFWLGSAGSGNTVQVIRSTGASILSLAYNAPNNVGVRPVIVVPKSEIEI